MKLKQNRRSQEPQGSNAAALAPSTSADTRVSLLVTASSKRAWAARAAAAGVTLNEFVRRAVDAQEGAAPARPRAEIARRLEMVERGLIAAANNIRVTLLAIAQHVRAARSALLEDAAATSTARAPSGRAKRRAAKKQAPRPPRRSAAPVKRAQARGRRKASLQDR